MEITKEQAIVLLRKLNETVTYTNHYDNILNGVYTIIFKLILGKNMRYVQNIETELNKFGEFIISIKLLIKNENPNVEDEKEEIIDTSSKSNKKDEKEEEDIIKLQKNEQFTQDLVAAMDKYGEIYAQVLKASKSEFTPEELDNIENGYTSKALADKFDEYNKKVGGKNNVNFKNVFDPPLYVGQKYRYSLDPYEDTVLNLKAYEKYKQQKFVEHPDEEEETDKVKQFWTLLSKDQNKYNEIYDKIVEASRKQLSMEELNQIEPGYTDANMLFKYKKLYEKTGQKADLHFEYIFGKGLWNGINFPYSLKIDVDTVLGAREWRQQASITPYDFINNDPINSKIFGDVFSEENAEKENQELKVPDYDSIPYELGLILGTENVKCINFYRNGILKRRTIKCTLLTLPDHYDDPAISVFILLREYQKDVENWTQLTKVLRKLLATIFDGYVKSDDIRIAEDKTMIRILARNDYNFSRVMYALTKVLGVQETEIVVNKQEYKILLNLVERMNLERKLDQETWNELVQAKLDELTNKKDKMLENIKHPNIIEYIPSEEVVITGVRNDETH